MYHYETLGDEKFQEFCQALIAIDFPTAQCLPVGQPDGGRDAYMHRYAIEQLTGTAELTVFQIKYSKTPTGDRSERDAIAEVVRTERDKVERLKALGLKRYILITNVKGTAHLHAGSIDKVNAELSELLGVEAYCWWRDDLDRRLDAASAVKWSYPEVLKATDLLEVLVRGQLGEEEDRRRNAIRAYLTDQYDDDLELKFKQTDLRSKMTDLFVDLPMSESRFDGQDDIPSIRLASDRLYRNAATQAWYYRDTRHAAEFLLSSGPRRVSRVLLEGAPGQGKSTVTQYVCQVMRMLMLDKHAELATLSTPKLTARLPFRVDLRDLAKWLGGTDPFQSKVTLLDDQEPKSLEGFLAAQVRHASGGATFNVSDLIAVAKASHLLLALDGFDEVADVAMRNILVTEISKGTSRLQNAGGFSVQTIVTSRPAAFAKSVRFPREQWAYFQLLPLERGHVDAYTEKWMRAKALKSTERQTLARVLNEKLEEAHTQYLAKNPMQLTILLSLINNRGASLPEKRTALYDAYMDMFFSRESEKSDIVRDNRDLLVDIHRYLAWRLQTGAEGGGSGSIEHSDLRATLFSYLDSQGEDTTIINGLFNGIIERVGALVSRVQDTFEFEVQPLREYFAARHLYETAPYSTIADEGQGTKLDRFQALVRNPYWLNVARFYGGCFSKGEVSALVDELALIAEEGVYNRTSHPRMVALILLSDWVFTQYQPAVKRIVELICQTPQLRQLLAAEQAGVLSWAPLPDRSGKQDFVDRLWERFVVARHNDERQGLAVAIGQNTSGTMRAELWARLKEKLDEDEWITTGARLGVFRTAPTAAQSLLPAILTPQAVKSFLDASQFDLMSRGGTLRDCAMVELLSGRYTSPASIHRAPFQDSDLFWAAKILNPYQYGLAFIEGTALPLYHILEARFSAGVFRAIPLDETAVSTERRTALEAYNTFLMTPGSVLSSSSSPWADLVETLRGLWGDCDAIDRIAVIAAGVRSRSEHGVDRPLRETPDLVESFRYARMKSGAPKWWEATLKAAENGPNLVRYLLVLCVWATPRTLFALAERLDCLLRELSPEDWDRLRQNHARCRAMGQSGQNIDGLQEADLHKLAKLGSRAATLLGTRLTGMLRYHVVKPILHDNHAAEPELSFALDAVYRRLREKPDWASMLSDVKMLYARGAVSHPTPRRDDWIMTPVAAEEILSSLEEYPLVLIAGADALVKSQVGEKTPKLADVALSEGWFR